MGTIVNLREWIVEWIVHPLQSPDLAAIDYYCFSILKGKRRSPGEKMYRCVKRKEIVESSWTDCIYFENRCCWYILLLRLTNSCKNHGSYCQKMLVGLQEFFEIIQFRYPVTLTNKNIPRSSLYSNKLRLREAYWIFLLVENKTR